MNSNHARTILHIDLDCFYCQVEQKRLGISPNVPVAVQQWEGLIAINYPARAAGITRHMRVHEAKALCPELQCVHVETIGGDELDTKDRTKQKACLERYRKACIQILAVLHKAAPQAIIEKASIDEVYMDVTTMVEKELRERAQADSCKNPENGEGGAHDWEAGGSPVDAFAWGSIVLGGGPLDVGSEFERRLSIGANIACRLRGAIREQLGFTCSAGIAANKLLAKVASAMNKPNQQTIVPPRAVDAMMADLPLKKLRNFGGKLGAELAAMGCTTAGQVAAIPHGQLSARFGEERAASIARAVRGYSDEPVQVKELAKSMLAAKSFNATSSPAELDRWIGILAEELAHRLTEDGIAHSRAPRGLTLSYRGSNGDRSKCGPAPRPTKDGYTVEALKEAGSMLLRKCPDIYPCARLALQANDFYDLPLGDDQGAISRFFTSGATGTRDVVGDGGAPAAMAAPKAKKSGPQQPSIAQMFKRAAAASSVRAEVQGTPSAQAESAATPAHPSAQNDACPGPQAPPSSVVPSRIAGEPTQRQEAAACSGPCGGASTARGSQQASQGGKQTRQPVQPASSSQDRQEGSNSQPLHDSNNDPAHRLQGISTGADVPDQGCMDRPPNACNAADGSEHGAAMGATPAARHSELGKQSIVEVTHSTSQQNQRHESSPGSTGPSERPDGSMPCQHPHGSESALGGPADMHPECDLASVDIEEQKRIMHEIWMRSRGNTSRTGEDNVRDATSAAADRSAKRGRVVSGAGSEMKEGAGKQMRISAMFKTPRKT
ncbi:DNA polymerase eta at N-terminal half [Coccomyxa sp. Obi]|nr:DNA polymerase eta at N-terminal half [Coccomyxa sp. Obi]